MNIISAKPTLLKSKNKLSDSSGEVSKVSAWHLLFATSNNLRTSGLNLKSFFSLFKIVKLAMFAGTKNFNQVTVSIRPVVFTYPEKVIFWSWRAFTCITCLNGINHFNMWRTVYLETVEEETVISQVNKPCRVYLLLFYWFQFLPLKFF